MPAMNAPEKHQTSFQTCFFVRFFLDFARLQIIILSDFARLDFLVRLEIDLLDFDRLDFWFD